MDMPGPLAGMLNELTAALEDPDTDLIAILGVLVDDVAAAIPSYLGLQVTLQLNGRPVTLSVIEDADTDAARASLRLPAAPSARAEPASAVILYAANPGAFVDLTADAERLWGLDGQRNLDQHLPAHADRPDSPADTLHQLSEINRAVGVLITQNFTRDRPGNVSTRSPWNCTSPSPRRRHGSSTHDDPANPPAPFVCRKVSGRAAP